MDISNTVIANSDQQNAENFIAGPRTFTVERVTEGPDDQPVNVHLVEDPKRAYRPSKSMRRVLGNIWGWDTNNWTGKSLTLFRNPNITFGKEKVGGIEISHMSHIEKPVTISLISTRGKRKPFTVKPLQVARPTGARDLTALTIDELRELHRQYPDLRAQIQAEVASREAADE